LVSNLKPEDAELLIRSAAGVSVNGAEQDFEKELRDQVINCYIEGKNGNMIRVFRNLRDEELNRVIDDHFKELKLVLVPDWGFEDIGGNRLQNKNLLIYFNRQLNEWRIRD